MSLWQNYSDDQSHPNERGHEIVRDFVTNYFEKVMEKVDENNKADIGVVGENVPLQTQVSENGGGTA